MVVKFTNINANANANANKTRRFFLFLLVVAFGCINLGLLQVQNAADRKRIVRQDTSFTRPTTFGQTNSTTQVALSSPTSTTRLNLDKTSLSLDATTDDARLQDITPGITIYSTDQGERRIPYLVQMKEKGLELSYKQQRKIFLQKDLVLERLQQRGDNTDLQHLLYKAIKDDNRFAFVLNNDYAFRHIYKNGGTTVELQTKQGHISARNLGERRRLVATVRDPIDHFLSGWAECGFRSRSDFTLMSFVNHTTSYDGRIREWLTILRTKECPQKKGDPVRHLCTHCRKHSYPQATFLLTEQQDKAANNKVKKKVIDPRVDLFGDIRELPHLLELAGFPFDFSKGSGRNATEDSFKSLHFPKQRHLLSNSTLIDLCKFLALDYYLLDYPAPEPCWTLPFFEEWSILWGQ